MIDAKETALHLNTLRAWKGKPLYSIPAEYGDVEDFRPILEKEVVDIKDNARRAEVLDAVIQQMESDRSCESVATDATEVGSSTKGSWKMKVIGTRLEMAGPDQPQGDGFIAPGHLYLLTTWGLLSVGPLIHRATFNLRPPLMAKPSRS
jgi:hypothetical protein